MNFWALGKNKKIFFINHVQFGPCLGNLILKNKLSTTEEINGKECTNLNNYSEEICNVTTPKTSSQYNLNKV